MDKAAKWHQAAAQCETTGRPWVMATILGTSGSTPREGGSKMVITGEHSFDTVGGGQLEYQIIELAREHIARGFCGQRLEHFPLSARSGQCCGGQVSVLLECFAGASLQLYVFGAGHVAKALVPILGELDLQVHWIDSREDQFPTEIPSNVTVCVEPDPVAQVALMPVGACALILTHQHALDYQLVEHLLDRQDCRFIGLIGSQTKARRFRKRLRSAAFSASEIERVQCPVGFAGIPGKKPMEVAVAIAAQLVELIHQYDLPNEGHTGLSWRELTAALRHSHAAETKLLPHQQDPAHKIQDAAYPNAQGQGTRDEDSHG